MYELSRRSVLAGTLAAGLWAAGASAQTKDLQVEAAPNRRPVHRPRRPQVERPVQVSLMPLGPSTLAIGQPLRFRMVALVESYGQLYVLSASGRSQLWMENVRLHAGAPLTFPSAGLIVRAAPPAGDEAVLFVATRSRFDGFLAAASSSAGPVDLQYDHDGFRAALQQRLDALRRTDWAIAENNIRVQE